MEQELPRFAALVRDPALQAQCVAVAPALRDGPLVPDQVALLASLAEMLLETGRARRAHGAGGERALQSFYAATPHGVARQTSVDDVNQALAALQGQPLVGLRLRATPGGHWLHVTTVSGELTIRLDRDGAQLQHLELGSTH